MDFFCLTALTSVPFTVISDSEEWYSGLQCINEVNCASHKLSFIGVCDMYCRLNCFILSVLCIVEDA
jgi:hypothetical protein